MDILQIREIFDKEHKLTFNNGEDIYDISQPGIDTYYLRQIDAKSREIKKVEQIKEENLNNIINRFICEGVQLFSNNY